MIEFNDLAVRRGPQLLFENANVVTHNGEKVGVVGANGTGKSTLLALMLGELESDAGYLSMPPKLAIAHVAQEVPETDRPAIEYVMDGDLELRKVQDSLADAEARHDGHALGELHARLDSIGGYSAESRAARLMHGLGFSPGEDRRPVSSFSGGWRMRLNLAQALMCRSDLLLLDEPTNHLDLETVVWLENWLRDYPGTLFMISHDREFLDRTVDHVVHIDRGRVFAYTGNYSDFESQRAARLAGQQAAFEKQQREIKHIQSFVTRFRAKATKARQAQSRLKALERMEKIAPAHVDSRFHFSFRTPEKLPAQLLKLDLVSAGYGEQTVVSGVKMLFAPGQRIGLLGRNGAGKSTLTRVIAGAMAPQSGSCLPAKDLVVGYFAQHQLELLDAEATPLLHLQRQDPKARDQALLNYLGGFGFDADKAKMPVAPFSGGEKARLVLAMIVYQKPNLLLLDEPTNHLDLDMRLALTMALQEFEGALVLVSHDRYLMRSVTDELWCISDGRAQPYSGDIDDYGKEMSEPALKRSTVQGSSPQISKKAQRQASAAARKRLQPLQKKARDLDNTMHKLQVALAELEDRLAAPGLYDADRKPELQSLLDEQGTAKQALHAAERAWLETQEELEKAESAAV